MLTNISFEEFFNHPNGKDLRNAVYENYLADLSPNQIPSEEDFRKEVERLANHGKHFWDCKCILCR